MTPRAAWLMKWVERVLLTVGAALALWSGFVLLEARRYARMPVPLALSEVEGAGIAHYLPGEASERAPSEPTRHSIGKGQWLARLDAPSVQMMATVLEGTDGRTLRRAAGHIEYTPLPGRGGNVGIAGHRDTTFRAVRNLKAGDPLTLTTADRVYQYRVTDIKIVEPEAVDVLDATDRPVLTLVTCYPFSFIGNAPKRYVVHAELTGERTR